MLPPLTSALCPTSDSGTAVSSGMQANTSRMCASFSISVTQWARRLAVIFPRSTALSAARSTSALRDAAALHGDGVEFRFQATSGQPKKA
jgi:hypothetical protein